MKISPDQIHLRFRFALPLDAAGKPVIHSGVKRILFFIVIALFSSSALRAQESATQQQIEQLNGRIQDLIEGQAAQGKRLDALAHDISELREKVNAPPANTDSVTHDELLKLAKTVKELADKQQADKELIVENIKQLGKTITEVPTSGGSKKNHGSKKADAKSDAKTDVKTDVPATPTGPLVGHEYIVKPGDQFSLIVKAYRDQGVKVTTKQVKEANPGLDPDKILVGQKIFIPDPAAK